MNGYDALREGGAAVLGERDVVVVEGPDAAEFLQGQLSQDLSGVDVGGSAASFLLQPKGKVVALVRVSQPEAGRFVLDTDPGFGGDVQARLLRFKLRVDCSLTARRWPCVFVRGVDASVLSDRKAKPLAIAWSGCRGFDLLGPDVTSPEGLVEASEDALEIVRIEAGWPKMGSEMDESTIPESTGVVAEAVSFTKGCYVGQELVARVQSRGANVPRRLCGLVAADALSPGDVVAADAETVGVVTSAAVSPTLGPVALSYISRKAEVGGRVGAGERSIEANLRALPLID